MFFFSLILLVAASCGTKSKKGAWNDADKKSFQAEVDKMKTSLESTLGANTQKYIDCFFEKTQANYENFETANKDNTGLADLSKDCAMDAMGAGK